MSYLGFRFLPSKPFTPVHFLFKRLRAELFFKPGSGVACIDGPLWLHPVWNEASWSLETCCGCLSGTSMIWKLFYAAAWFCLWFVCFPSYVASGRIEVVDIQFCFFPLYIHEVGCTSQTASLNFSIPASSYCAKTLLKINIGIAALPVTLCPLPAKLLVGWGWSAAAAGIPARRESAKCFLFATYSPLCRSGQRHNACTKILNWNGGFLYFVLFLI